MFNKSIFVILSIFLASCVNNTPIVKHDEFTGLRHIEGSGFFMQSNLSTSIGIRYFYYPNDDHVRVRTIYSGYGWMFMEKIVIKGLNEYEFKNVSRDTTNLCVSGAGCQVRETGWFKMEIEDFEKLTKNDYSGRVYGKKGHLTGLIPLSEANKFIVFVKKSIPDENNFTETEDNRQPQQ